MKNNEPRDMGLVIHRWLQWIASVGVTFVAAAMISGWDTWDAFKSFMVRMEDVPSDIKEMKNDLEDVKGKTRDISWRVTVLENKNHR